MEHAKSSCCDAPIEVSQFSGRRYCLACGEPVNLPALPVKKVPYKEKELRDEFALAALTGILSDPNSAGSNEYIAAQAYDYADAMLEARKK